MAERMDTRAPRRRPLHERHHPRDRQSVDRRERRRSERRHHRRRQVDRRGHAAVAGRLCRPSLQLVNSSSAHTQTHTRQARPPAACGTGDGSRPSRPTSVSFLRTLQTKHCAPPTPQKRLAGRIQKHFLSPSPLFAIPSTTLAFTVL